MDCHFFLQGIFLIQGLNPGLLHCRQILYHWATIQCEIQCESERKWSCSVVSDSLRPHGLQPTRLLHPWDFPGKNTGVGCHFLLQEIFLIQGLNPGLLHCRQMLYHLSRQRSTITREKTILDFKIIKFKILSQYMVLLVYLNIHNSFTAFHKLLLPSLRSEVKWSEFAQSCPTLCDPVDCSVPAAYQAPQSMQFFRQEYWSGVPFPSPGDLPDPGIKPRSLALQAEALPSEPSGKPSLRKTHATLHFISYGCPHTRVSKRSSGTTITQIPSISKGCPFWSLAPFGIINYQIYCFLNAFYWINGTLLMLYTWQKFLSLQKAKVIPV